MSVPDVRSVARKVASDAAELKRRRERVPEHNLADHFDANLGQTAGKRWVPVYNPETGEWELGSAGGIPTIVVRPALGAPDFGDVPYGAWYTLPLDLDANYGGFWTFDAAAKTVTPAAACLAEVGLIVSWASDPAGQRAARVGALGIVKSEDAAADGQDHTLSWPHTVTLAAGQAIDFRVYQTNSTLGPLALRDFPFAVKCLWRI